MFCFHTEIVFAVGSRTHCSFQRKFLLKMRGISIACCVMVVLSRLVVVVQVHAQEDGCANVVDASAQQSTTTETWTFSVTISSDYETGWDKYADEFQVRVGDQVLGTRTLLHPHVSEQPFTRALSDVVVPEDVMEVLISARDSVSGYCGDEFTLQLQRSATTTVPQAEPSLSDASTTAPTSTTQPTLSSSTGLDEGQTDALIGSDTSGACGLNTLFSCCLVMLKFVSNLL